MMYHQLCCFHFHKEVLGQLGHGFCVDYWGLGMIVYEMMTGLPPWYTTDRSQLFRRLKSAPLDIPSYFSESSADCVAALLERNPRRRLGVTGIRTAMEHSFFRNISWRALYSRRIEAPVQPCEGWKPPDASGSANGNYNINNTANFQNKLNGNGNAVMNQFDAHMLDNATQNFDAQFTRMAVESEDHHQYSQQQQQGSPYNTDGVSPGEEEFLEDLNEDTFLGFSFDIVKERMDGAPSDTPPSAEQQQQQRYRTQNYHVDQSGLPGPT